MDLELAGTSLLSFPSRWEAKILYFECLLLWCLVNRFWHYLRVSISKRSARKWCPKSIFRL